MTAQASCPDRTQLQQLLDPATPENQQTELIGHLDRCPGCQQALEELARGNEPWTEEIRQLENDRPGSNSAYWPALARLEKDLASGRADTALIATPLDMDEVSLTFLQPAEDPNSLGRLGSFEVVEVIGRGGMGIVLKAFDPSLQRYVALKVLDPQYGRDELAQQRFCREARAAAQVTHEHVVAIHAVNKDEKSGVFYLVMQLVSGNSLQQRLDPGRPLPLRDVVRIGAQVAAGLAAAHGQGLVHRDIKPANILLESSLGSVKLTDFGLARATEDSKLTQTGYVAGTPLYMAPEQARGEALDHRTDLFSLGSVLYAMCTGTAPFEGTTAYIVLKRVTEETARPVRELNPDVPDWLARIIDQLLAKNPTERFQSAAEVAELLQYHLAALPPTGVIPNQATVPEPARWSRATQRRWMILAALPWLLLGVLLATEALGITDLRRLLGGPGAEDIPDQSIASLPGGGGPVWGLAFSPDGETLAMATDEGNVKLWNVDARSLRVTIHAHTTPVWAIKFFPDGRFVTGSSDLTIKIWSPQGDLLRTIDNAGAVRALIVSPDGHTLVSGGRDGAARIWDADTGKLRVATTGHPGEVIAAAFAPDGKRFVTGTSDKTARIWDAATGRELAALPHRGSVYAVAFSPDGHTLASGGWDKIVRLSDVAKMAQVGVLRGHTQDVRALAFSPDGRTLATGSEDWTVKLWDVQSRKDRVTLHGQKAAIYSLVYSPDGSIIATGGRDGTVRLWDARR